MTGARNARNVILIDVTCGRYGRTMAAQLPGAMLVDFTQTSPGECTRLLSRADVVVVGVWRDDGSHTAPLVTWLRRCDPRITIYVCDNGTRAGSLPIRAFAVAGADDLVSLCSTTELRPVIDTISKRQSAPTPAQELRELHAALPRGTASNVALHCVRNSVLMRTEADVARWFGVTVQTLNNQLRSIAMPSAGVCIRCGVEFHRAELERRGDFSREELARRLALPSAAAMRSRRNRLVQALRRTKERGAVLERLLRPADGA